MSAATDAYMATTPHRFWPLTETSGTNANELVANEDGTCVGMVMGGADGPFGIGGKAPVFSGGSEHILLRSAAILGGMANWSVGAWFFQGGSTITSRHLYGEANPTTGNDRIAVGFKRNSTGIVNIQAEHTYGADSGAASLFSASVYEYGYWAFYVWTRSGATIEIWRANGRRMVSSSSVASSTWTNSGVVSWIGSSPRLPAGTSPWIGNVSHLALWNRVLTGAEITDIYEATTPPSRVLLDQPLWHANSPFNQDLLDPLNPPTIDPNSAATVAHLGAQINYYGTGNNPAGPVWVADNTDPVEAVRIESGQNNIPDIANTVEAHPLWDALQTVPIPAGFDSVTSSDQQGTIVNVDTGELWEFIELNKFLRSMNVGPVIVPGGSLSAGQIWWYVCGVLVGGETGRLGSTTTTVNGSQGVHLYWYEVEGAHHYNIYRYTPQTGMTNPPGAQLVGTTPAGTLDFLDTGSVTPGAFYPGLTATVATWGTLTAGYIDDVDTHIGIWLPPRQQQGATATSLPIVAGAITLAEMQAGVIDHALAMSMAEVIYNDRCYPAQRNDGSYDSSGNAIREATRFQLDPTFDIDAYFGPNREFEKMVFRAVQKYGAYVRDVSQRPAFYIEEQAFVGGRDLTAGPYQGRYDYEIYDVFPWDHLRVIDPAWTQAQAAIPLTTKWEDFTDAFDAFDTVGSWQVLAGTASVDTRKLHMTQPFTLVESRFTADLLASEVVIDVSATGGAYAEGDAEVVLVNEMLQLRMGVFASPSPVILFMDARSAGDVITRLPATPNWDPVETRYWRISEAGGTISFATSPDSATWTTHNTVTRGSLGHAASAYEELTLQFQTNAYGSNPPPLPDFIINGVNVVGSGLATTINLPTFLSLKSRVTEVVIDGD